MQNINCQVTQGLFFSSSTECGKINERDTLLSVVFLSGVFWRRNEVKWHPIGKRMNFHSYVNLEKRGKISLLLYSPSPNVLLLLPAPSSSLFSFPLFHPWIARLKGLLKENKHLNIDIKKLCIPSSARCQNHDKMASQRVGLFDIILGVWKIWSSGPIPSL